MASGYGWTHNASCSNLTRNGATVSVKVSTDGSSYYSGTLYIDGTAVGSSWVSANGGSSSGSRTLTWNCPGAFSSRQITCRMVYQIQKSGGSNSHYLYPETGSLSAMRITAIFNNNYTSGGFSTKTQTYDTSWSFNDDPVRTGYSFLGWFDSATGGTQITTSTTVTSTSDVVLYAHWQQEAGLDIRQVASGIINNISTIYQVSNGIVSQINTVYKVSNGVVSEMSGSTARLPAGYQELSYIQSSGEEWLDTGINMSDIKRGEITFTNLQDYPPSHGYTRLFGAEESSNVKSFFITPCAGTEEPRNFQAVMNGGYWSVDFAVVSTELTFVFDFTGTKPRYSITDGATAITGIYDTTDLTVINKTAFLFTFRRGDDAYSRKIPAKVFSMKLWGTNNTLLRNLVPALRRSDSEIGLYDLVSNTFLTNSGSGAFTGGQLT